MAVGLRGRGYTLTWPVLPFCIVRPNTGNREPALRAGAILDAILQHFMPRAADKQFLALRTICIRAIAVDISLVDVAQAHVERNLPRTVESLGRRPWLVLQLGVRVERGEMQRHVRPKMSQNPFGKLPRFCRIVIQGWNHQGGDL